MSDNYMIVHMDELGRVVIPVQIRKRLNMRTSGKVKLSFDNTSVRISAINMTKLHKQIIEFKELANNNKNINDLEYDKLCEILDKLGDE